MLYIKKGWLLSCIFIIVVSVITLVGCGSDEKFVYVQAAGSSSDVLLKHLAKVVEGQETILNTSSFSLNVPAGIYDANTEIAIIEDVNYSTLDSSFPTRFVPQSSLLTITVTEPQTASLRGEILGGLLGSSVPLHNYMTIGKANISVRLSNLNNYDANAKYFMACRVRSNGKSAWCFYNAEYANGVFTTWFNTKYDGLMLVKLSDDVKTPIAKGFKFDGTDTVDAGYVSTFSQDIDFTLGVKLDTENLKDFSYDKLDISFVSFDRIAKPSLVLENLAGNGENYELTMQGSDGYYYTMPAKLGLFSNYAETSGNATYTFRIKIKGVNFDDFPETLLMKSSYKLTEGEEYVAEKLVKFTYKGGPAIYPEIVSVFPEDGSVNLLSDVNNRLSVIFKNEMDVKSLKTCLTIQEKDDDTTAEVCEFVGLSENGLNATFPFTLQAGKEYLATIATTATNIYGHKLVEPYSWSFSVVKYSGPEATSVNRVDGAQIPAASATRVATNTPITVVYEKAISNTLDVDIQVLENNVNKPLYDYVWLNENKSVTVTPVSPFNYGSTVTVNAVGGKDIDGYDVTELSFSFTVVEQNALVDRSPAINATDVGIDEPILVTFSDSMEPELIDKFTVQRKLANEAVYSDFNAVSKSLRDGNTVVRIVPSGGNSWDYNTSYKVSISGEVKDAYNNNAIVDMANWTFDTVEGSLPGISSATVNVISTCTAQIDFSITINGGKPINSDAPMTIEVVEATKSFESVGVISTNAIKTGNNITAIATGLSRDTTYKFRFNYKLINDDSQYRKEFEERFATPIWLGSGTESDPYQVSNEEEFVYIATICDKGESCYFIQTKDIVLSSDNWLPLGTTLNKPFKGVYDGNSKVISGLRISTSDSNVGLFGHVLNATLKNIKINDADISVSGTGSYVGALAGYIGDSKVENCSVGSSSDLTSIVGYRTVGGIVGEANNATFTSCVLNGKINVCGISTSNTMVGGFIGQVGSNCSFDNCQVNSTDGSYNFIKGYSQVGGFAGITYDAATLFKNCGVSNVKVTHEQDVNNNVTILGSFIGEMYGGIVNVATIENVTVEADFHVGGIVGRIPSDASGSIISCLLSNVHVVGRGSGSHYNVGIIYGEKNSEIAISGCRVTVASTVTAEGSLVRSCENEDL